MTTISNAPFSQPVNRPLKIFLSAGEASGEHYGALLIKALRDRAPHATFFGLGGTQMEAMGFERVVRAEDVAHMGIAEVIRHAATVYRAYRRLVKSLRQHGPDAAVLIDFPDVNLRLAKHLKRAGIPVIYFVSPQLWAWKKRRIRWVRERVTKMLVIFPFEQSFYRDRGVDAEFVGHPLADTARPDISREAFAAAEALDPRKHWVALLPGSRTKEVRLNLPVMIEAAARLGTEYEYIVPIAPTLQIAELRAALDHAAGNAGLKAAIRLTDDAATALIYARASVVASGTATVLAALMGNPFVAVYRVSPVTYAIAKRLIDLPHVIMVNLIAGERIVPELIQSDFTAENVLRELRPLLVEGEQRHTQMAGLAQVRRLLDASKSDITESAIQRVAAHVIQSIK